MNDSTKSNGKSAKAKAKAKAKSRQLERSKVFVRLRPIVFDGSGHDQSGEAVAKSLENFTDKTISLKTEYLFSNGSAQYSFDKVFDPSSTQEQVFEQVIPDLMGKIDHQDVMLLAYGQTGTGKTTTMFGFQNSLTTEKRGENDNQGWGIVPRLAHELFAKFRKESTPFQISLSAIEFYLDQVVDLLPDEPRKIGFNVQNKASGYTRKQLKDPSDILQMIELVISRRTSRGTKMNKSSVDHGGSSRSHCSLIFTVGRMDQKNEKFKETLFHVVDLAGAERPSKVGAGDEKVSSGGEAAFKLWQGLEISAQEEGLLINYNLFEVCKEVKLATNLHKKGKEYKPPRQMSLPLTAYLGNCLNGRAALAMIVCVSQAPQCGWETWFSMQYGTDLAALRVPIRKPKPFLPLKKTLKAKEEAKATAQAELSAFIERNKTRMDMPNTKRFLHLKTVHAFEATEQFQFLEKLELASQT